MQQVSSKKMSHTQAIDYREKVQDAVMYQHRNGSIYVLPSPDDVEHVVGVHAPVYVTEDANLLLIGNGVREAREALRRIWPEL